MPLSKAWALFWTKLQAWSLSLLGLHGLVLARILQSQFEEKPPFLISDHSHYLIKFLIFHLWCIIPSLPSARILLGRYSKNFPTPSPLKSCSTLWPPHLSFCSLAMNHQLCLLYSVEPGLSPILWIVLMSIARILSKSSSPFEKFRIIFSFTKLSAHWSTLAREWEMWVFILPEPSWRVHHSSEGLSSYKKVLFSVCHRLLPSCFFRFTVTNGGSLLSVLGTPHFSTEWTFWSSLEADHNKLIWKVPSLYLKKSIILISEDKRTKRKSEWIALVKCHLDYYTSLILLVLLYSLNLT